MEGNDACQIGRAAINPPIQPPTLTAVYLLSIPPQFWHGLLLFVAAAVAGAVNSVAGGGTLLTFPTLIWLGVPAKIANATSTAALWPGALSSLWGYRSEMGGSRAWLIRFGVVSLAGGLLGARLLLNTRSEVFQALVPYLILMASLLFLAQEPISRWLRSRQSSLVSRQSGTVHRAAAITSLPGTGLSDAPPITSSHHHVITPASLALGLFFQFAVAVYGGYFGAGIGILMLAALGLMGMDQIHRMNGVKNFAALCINGVAAATFIDGGAVDWPLALLMAVGAILGGYAGAGTARRLGPRTVRRLIIAIGLGIGLSMLLRGR
jgi:uncharacterized protein